jgi:Rrf2 family protein
MKVTARGDYAVRVALELAAREGETRKLGELAELQQIPPRSLENILVALRRAGLVRSRRGTDGGFWLALAPDQITVADVLRAAEGPLANVQGVPPEGVSYGGSAVALRDVWVAARASLRTVLERVTWRTSSSSRCRRRFANSWWTRRRGTSTRRLESFARRHPTAILARRHPTAIPTAPGAGP